MSSNRSYRSSQSRDRSTTPRSVRSSRNLFQLLPDQTETIVNLKAASEGLGLGLDLDPRQTIEIINVPIISTPTSSTPLTPSDQYDYGYGNANNYISDEGIGPSGTTGLSQPLNNCNLIDLEDEMNNFLSPEPPGGYPKRPHEILEDMDDEQYKLFHDEVIQILSGLDDLLRLDHTKKWFKISRHVSKNIMPTVSKALEGNFRFKLSELNHVLKNLHRHRHELWKIKQDPEKFILNKKRIGVNRRCQEKTNRRIRGIDHLVNAKDKNLVALSPTMNIERAQSERQLKIHPKNKEASDNYVLRVKDKPLRSQR
ncbi:4336_t:CDS:2, partial [Ambispora leptoticha]